MVSLPLVPIRPVVAWSLVLGLFACASAPAGPPIDAPRLAVGDRWQYRITDNLRRGLTSQLDAEVISVTGPSARVRLAVTDNNGRYEWVDDIEGGGALRAGTLWREAPRPFNPPVELLAFPLADGKTWRQTIDTIHPDTQMTDQILVYGKVDGRKTATVPAGVYDAVYVYRVVQLDDRDFWRTRTTRRDAVWYAPEVKAPVREAREAEYTEIGGQDMATVTTENTVAELVSFQPGR
ncbi:MAG TPA: hypothetical protein VMN79_08805 [Casimicrobiaceae bacterium]|nr:hypothetical protein [Casimicrobiaceae bacterium]